MKYLLIGQLIVLMLTVVSSDVILFNDEVITIESWTVHFWNGEEFLSEPFNISGKIVLQDDDVDNKIALHPCALGVDTIAADLKERGAIAVIFGSCVSTPYGRAGYRLTTPRTEFSMPVIQVNEENFDIIQKAVEDGEVYAVLTSEDPSLNPNTDFVFGGTVLMIFGWVYFSAMLIITIALIVFELRDNTEFGVKMLILIMSMITFIMGIVFTGIDPLGSRRTLSWAFPIFYYIFNIPMMVIVELLVSVLWFDSVQQSLFSNNFLIKTRIPFLVICGVFTLCTAISFIVALINPLLLQAVFGVTIFFWIISILILSIFHLVVGIYLFGRIKNIQTKAKLKKTSYAFIYKIFGIVTFDLLQVLLLILFSGGTIVLPNAVAILSAILLVVTSGFRAAVILSLFTWKISSTSSTKGASTGESKKSITTKNDQK